MKKIWTIAWKDTITRLRDRNAMLLTLLTPLLVAGIMGVALNGDGARPDLPAVIVVNQDEGPLGKIFEAALAGGNAGAELKLSSMSDLARAREMVKRGEADALIQAPRDLSATLLSSNGASVALPIIQFASGVEDDTTAETIRRVSGHAARRLSAFIIGKQMAAARFQIGQEQDAHDAQLNAAFGQELATQIAGNGEAGIELKSAPAGNVEVSRNPFAFFAPSLAIFFLMISMIEAPRSILVERESGTLGRLIRTPISPGQLLLGKLGGSYLTGVLQFSVLVVASRIIFGLTWGHSLPGLALMVVAVVVASASLGAAVAAFSKNTLQAGALGTGITLISAGLGGNFSAADNLPTWLQVLSRLTINRWALEGFSKLIVRDLEAQDILINAGVLFGIAVSLFMLAFRKFQHQITG